MHILVLCTIKNSLSLFCVARPFAQHVCALRLRNVVAEHIQHRARRSYRARATVTRTLGATRSARPAKKRVDLGAVHSACFSQPRRRLVPRATGARALRGVAGMRRGPLGPQGRQGHLCCPHRAPGPIASFWSRQEPRSRAGTLGSNVSGGGGTGAQQGVNARREAEDKTWAG